MTVAGHSLEELWQKFPSQTGIGWQAWNQDHLGDAIEYQNGKAINLGKCKLCVGTTRVPCAICQGQGQVTCPICNGKKIVSLSWSLSDSPKMKFRPKVFKLKNGREIVGKQLMVIGNDTTIHTETGDVNIKVSDIVTEAKLTPPK